MTTAEAKLKRILGPPGSTGPDELNLRVVDVLATENDDPEMHFTVLVVETL